MQRQIALRHRERRCSGVTQERQHGGAQQRNHQWRLPEMDGTGVLAEGDITHPMETVFDVPVRPGGRLRWRVRGAGW